MASKNFDYLILFLNSKYMKMNSKVMAKTNLYA